MDGGSGEVLVRTEVRSDLATGIIEYLCTVFPVLVWVVVRTIHLPVSIDKEFASFQLTNESERRLGISIF